MRRYVTIDSELKLRRRGTSGSKLDKIMGAIFFDITLLNMDAVKIALFKRENKGQYIDL